ncbi:MAG: DNA gyrase subunit A [Armatimonadota bacterium]|nr:DNA gyrase subunit A [Armatimonadota bacterium]MDR7562430.1 DNA gyrase subunit A [Armatimonadota bacterium]MDR7601510.1 DNA gyrase subunit A [Armatimonadota bacterium]
MAVDERVLPKPVEREMQEAYLDYAMSVIVSRALPDVRDGLKPVQRRILVAMHDLGLAPNRPYRKCAKICGDTSGNYHPHGEGVIYPTLVRLAQDWVMRYPLVDGQGNFGSIDDDPPAQMRYTEARLTAVAMEMLADLDKDTVDFVPNFDQSRQEPTVLPARFPNLLVNGASGIAVGMATNIPPHNLREVCDALVAMLDRPDLPTEELLKILRGPDFPTGGLILGREGIREAYTKGRGTIVMRAKAHIEELRGGRAAIVVTELPYLVNKAALISRIAELVRQKRIQGIGDLRDESDREGIRVVIELRREANPQVVLNQLYKHTQMQTNFGAILLALVNGVPRQLTLRDLLWHYLEHRRTVTTRRVRFELARAEERAHILEGLRVALDHLDRVIALIRASRDVPTAREGLMKTFGLSPEQAEAILEMRLQRLTGLERGKVEEEYRELLKAISYYQDVLRDPRKVDAILREEILELKEKYGDPRRTKITTAEEATFEEEDLVPDTEVVVTLTRDGFIKRVPLETYRAQRRGGRGVVGAAAREEDFVEHLLVTTNHTYLLFFTNRGKVYRLRAFDVPESGRTARGTGLMNLVNLGPAERVTAVIPVRSFEDGGYLFMVTKQGLVKKTGLLEFVGTRRAGLVAITLKPGDELVAVRLTDGRREVILGSREGQCIRFREAGVREMGRAAAGVLGIRLRPGDEVVGAAVVGEKPEVLTVTDQGYATRTRVEEYRLQARGGAGVRNVRVGPKNGRVVAIRGVGSDDELLLASEQGQILRTWVREIRTVGRGAQGVRVMRLDPGDRVSAVAVVEPPQG